MRSRILRFVSQFDGYYCRPPLDMKKIRFGKREVACLNDDGLEVWIGTLDEWQFHTDHREFLKICLWYLWMRTVIDWFGLRSWLYYKLLALELGGAP